MRLIGIIWISEKAADVTLDGIADSRVVCQHFKTHRYVVLKQTITVVKLGDSDIDSFTYNTELTSKFIQQSRSDSEDFGR